VLSGAFEKNGELRQLGRKYFEKLYFDKIGSEEYRKVLRAMAVHFDKWVHKRDIQKETKLKPTTLDNALMALKTRNIILPQRGKREFIAYRVARSRRGCVRILMSLHRQYPQRKSSP
jgi:hypothetical protein